MKNLKIYRQDLLLEQLNVNRVPNIGKVIRDSGITVMSIPSMVMKDYRALAVIDSSWNGIYINKKVSKKYKVSMFLINERKNLMEHEKQKAKLKVIQGGRRR